MAADVKRVVWSHVSTPPIRLLACIGKLYLYFALLQTAYRYSWGGENLCAFWVIENTKHRKELYRQKIRFFIFIDFWFCCTVTAFPRSSHNKRGIYMTSWASFSIPCLHQSLSRTPATVSQLFPSGHRLHICGLHRLRSLATNSSDIITLYLLSLQNYTPYKPIPCPTSDILRTQQWLC